MLTVQSLLDEGLLSPSLANIIFSTDPLVQFDQLRRDGLIHTSYRICLVYSALIQAFVIGKAICGGECVDELPYRHTASKILEFWTPKTNASFKNMERNVFSFLFDAISDEDCEMFEDSAKTAVAKIRSEYALYLNKNRNYVHKLTDADITDLLRALPLLRTTEIDAIDFKFLFSSQNKTFEIKCTPFIGFWNKERSKITENETDCGYVLVSVKTGADGGELRMELALLDEYSTMQTKTVRYSSNNEYLRMVCNAVRCPLEWSSNNNYHCDLAFLRTLTSASAAALEAYWRKNSKTNKIRTGLSISSYLKKMFIGSELYDAINPNEQILIEDLENTFYGLFIKYGIFKTMYALFLDVDNFQHDYSRELFELYMDNLTTLTGESRARYKTECKNHIDEHLSKLEKIVPKGTTPFVLRSQAIFAEWMAYCVLKATGLQADKLFPEEENIRSIDDFYYMIKNPSTKITDDLRDVLVTLISFYEALINSTIPFDEMSFQKRLWQEKRSLHTLSIPELAERFKLTVAGSKGNEMLDQFLGKSIICDLERLSKVLDNVLEELDNPQTPVENHRKRILISYAHEDKDVVRKIAEAWKNSGIDLYVDFQELESGDNWQFEISNIIDSPECKMVIVFLSKQAILKDAVAWEIGHAHDTAERRFPGDTTRQNEFIVAVNLEEDDLNKYLKSATFFRDPNENSLSDKCSDAEKVETHKLSQKQQAAASEIKDVIKTNILHRNYPSDMPKLENEIRNVLATEEEGIEVDDSKEYNDLELEVANFYAFLKLGDTKYEKWCDRDEIDNFFKMSTPSCKECIFPLVTSVKETKIKRDNIALVGYEIIGSKENKGRSTNYILSSKFLPPDDYYCLPNIKTTAPDCSWMVEPFLISYNLFIKDPGEE